MVSRDLLVKTALGISDTFETRWVRHCLEQGWKLRFSRQGVEPLTGREPKAYADRIRGYCRTLREYGIEWTNGVENDLQTQSPQRAVPSGRPKRARVITSSELDAWRGRDPIVLEQGDLITELAKEKAQELGIELIRE